MDNLNLNIADVKITTKELAAILGVTEKYLSELHNLHGCPRSGFNEWSMRECFVWALRYYKDLYEKQVAKIRGEKSHDLLARRSAELKEIQIKEKQKNLVDVSDVASSWVGELNVIIGSLKGFSITVAPYLKNKNDVTEIIEIIDGELNKVSAQIAGAKLELPIPETLLDEITNDAE